MLLQKMSIPGPGDSYSSGISTLTRLPDAALQDPAIDLALYVWLYVLALSYEALVVYGSGPKTVHDVIVLHKVNHCLTAACAS